VAKKIEARNAHGLFTHEFERLRFSEVLQKKLRSVCFTEAPLPALTKLTDASPILEPYGVAFCRSLVLQRGGGPVAIVNGYSGSQKHFWLQRFRRDFSDIRTWKKYQSRFGKSLAILRDYAMRDAIQVNYDFAWEREWRHLGDFSFKYREVAAIICPYGARLRRLAKWKMTNRKFKLFAQIPIVDPELEAEEIREHLADCSPSCT
jgi:hypothetical protein